MKFFFRSRKVSWPRIVDQPRDLYFSNLQKKIKEHVRLCLALNDKKALDEIADLPGVKGCYRVWDLICDLKTEWAKLRKEYLESQ